MRWRMGHTEIYFAVNYIGLLDEFAVFRRPLTAPEIRRLAEDPGALAAE